MDEEPTAGDDRYGEENQQGFTDRMKEEADQTGIPRDPDLALGLAGFRRPGFRDFHTLSG
jgi:hypothetical protein